MTAKRYSRKRLVLTAIVLAALALHGCERVPLVAPTEGHIKIFATSSVIGTNGATAITATVSEQNGTPVQNGTVVSFTTTLGTIEPRETRTDGGVATVRLTSSGQSGTATVRAFSGNTASDPISVRVGGAAAARVVLNATPTNLTAAGGTVQLLAIVTDTSGNRLAGVPVIFTSTAGVLVAATVVTDLNGEARNAISTARETIITATAGEQKASATITVNAGPVVSITPPSTLPIARQQAAVFSVTVTPGGGATGSPITNVRVEFGDQDFIDLGPVSGTISVSHVYDRGGTYRVTVTATDTSGQRTSVSTAVAIAEQAPLNVTISPSTTTARPNQPVTFTANVTSSGGGSISVELFDWQFIGAEGIDLRRTTGNTTSHTFGAIGTKTIKVDVFGTFGQIGHGEIQISVELPPATLR